MTTPILSICIATYNRAGFIGETLDSIIVQLTDEVEVVVVDGASTDNTEEVVNVYCKKSKYIRYFRLPVKGGVDHDYDKGVDLARGEMVWLFTDDDLFKPDAIEVVLSAIKKGYDLVIVNSEVRSRDLSIVQEDRRIVKYENRTYTNNEMELLFVDLLQYLTFIGSVVIRRKLWLNRERKLYYGTEFIHVGVIFQQPLPGSVLFIADPLISIRYDNAQWESRRFEIWMLKWPKLVWSFIGISTGAKMKITPKEPWRKIQVLMVQRSIGVYNVQIFKQYFQTKEVNIVWKCCALLISILPRFFFTEIRSVYSYLKNAVHMF